MPTESMDSRSYSSSFFASSASRDVNFLNERQRQVGFWKSEQNYDNIGEAFVREKRTAIEYPIPKPVRHPQPLIPTGEFKPQYETSLFSSSLSDLLDRRLRFSVESTGNFHSVGNAEEDEPLESLEDIEAQTIGNLLPKEEDLLSDLTYQTFPNDPNNEDLDLFSSVGGMEMETERSHTPDTSDSFQKYPQIISRTLLIRNIASNVEDSDLKGLFEPYGHIRSLYTASKNQGFVMVSYFDLRAAKSAMDSLLSRQRTLDIRYFSPKSPENNEGFVVIHDLDSSSSYIKKIFSVYGDIKDIREVQGRNNCKCIEYFDIRSAEAALLALNKDDFFKKQASFHRFSPSPGFCYGHELPSTGSTSLPIRNMNSNFRISPKFDASPGGFHPSYRYEHPSMILPSSYRSAPQIFPNNYTGSAPTSNPSIWSNFADSSSKSFFQNSGTPQRGAIFKTQIPSFDERARRGRIDSGIAQADKRLYDLDLDRIMRGEDNRTTLMIKNIPNKYTSKMLLAAIDERHKGAYDFIYLPIDFKNKCNVGYAFINMIDPSKIISFYQSFNGKKWEKFNSEKVATLAYGRIQGKNALVAHFQNSSLMNEDKRCRPILFSTDGDQVPFPMGLSVRSRNGKPQGVGFDEGLRGSDFPFGSSSSLSQNEYVAC